ncbi:hypothetical protein AB0E88_27995 [Streptomyces sp. NPDC028635]|uniref:hypothetical protein n=1 Tax=Streptomyces sp. NPDC028635 TaxID=3154800 RepID=UPI003404023E
MTEEIPGAQAIPAPTPTSDPGEKRRRGRLAVVAGSLVLAGALVSGVCWTVMTVRGANRQAGAAVWEFPEKTPEAKVAAPAQQGLAGLLVPYGSGTWSRGPDIGQYGADAQLSGAQATALRKESLRGLPRSQRRRLEEQIDKQRLQGMVMRSYVDVGTAEADMEGVASVQIQLARMGNAADVRNIARFQGAFLEALDVYRAGPAVKGHKNAKCFLTPKDTDEELEGMFCSAYAGDVLVTVVAEGAKPLEGKKVAALLGDQLDRIAGQGEAV